jgi:hypothetical protein
MIAPELDPTWVVAYWTVVAVALAVSVWAIVVVVTDFVHMRHADVDPAPPVRVARPRVDPAAHQTSPLAAVPRVRPRDAGLADSVMSRRARR